MPLSNDFIEYVIEQLAPFARVTSRRMFGGAGLYADGLFFALIASDSLYFKVDDSNRADYEARGCKPFVPFPEKPELSMNYYDVPAELLDDSEELCRWARKSVAVALAAANKKARRPVKKKAAKKKTPARKK
jgi:DNA transformation protein